MITEFSAENFRSLKDRVTLSLVAAPLRARGVVTDDNNLIRVNDRLSLLRGAAIYGANASGKSNLVRAMDCFRLSVSRSASYQQEDELTLEPFMLTPHTQNAPSTLEIVFLTGGIQYRYGFTADRAAVHAEWLFALTSSRESILFTRDRTEDKQDGLRGIAVNRQRFKEAIGTEKQTGINQLFLSKVAANQGALASQMRDFIVNQFQTVDVARDEKNAAYTMSCLHGDKNGCGGRITELVRRLDVDIVGLRLDEKEPTAEMLERMKDRGDLPKDAKEVRLRTIFTTHTVRDADGIPLSESEYNFNDSVSQGTRKLIALSGYIVDVLDHGKTLFVDELDSRLHPKMTRALLSLFLSPETNPRNAQIIFTTHDTNLLDRRLFRRDQIWFCEKDRDATRLYSLADFVLPESKGGSNKVRNDASYETDYIEGRYGAVPYLGDLRGLFQEELTEEGSMDTQEVGEQINA